MNDSQVRGRLGTVLRGKYRLEAVLGVGGMAAVYRATHRNRATFAVKVLHRELSLNDDIRARFLREGYAANSVSHPGAVLVVDDDVSEDGAAFLVMELLDGKPCDEIWGLAGQRVAPEVATAIAVQLLEVLAAAHANGIVHRDIKPANLFLTRRGVLKVLDFGIARAREAIAGDAHATSTGMTLGTPAFMAPEQARGRSREVDGRTDLWAVGATLFTLVSGQFVHQAETPQEMLVEAATRQARKLLEVVPVSASLAAAVDGALAFRREDRWPTATAMRDALQGGVAYEPLRSEAILAAVLSGERVASWLPANDARGPSLPVNALTTAAPTSNDRDEALPPAKARARPARLMIGGGLLLAAALTLGVAVRSRHAPLSPEARSSAGEGALEAAAEAGPPPRGEPAEPAPVVALELPSAAPPPPTATDSASATTSKAPAPKPLPPPLTTTPKGGIAPPLRATAPGESTAPPKATSPKPAPSCAQPFDFDAQGRKHFKPECYLMTSP